MDKTTPTSTTLLIRANMSCAVLQSWFSFFIRLHGQPEPFGSCNILQSCSSFFFCLHGTWAVRYRLLSPVFGYSPTHCRHLAPIFWEWPGAVSCGFLFSYFASYLQPFFPLFFSNWSSVCFKFLISKWTFLFVYAKAALAYSHNEQHGCEHART